MWCIRVVDNNYYLANWAEQTQLISNEKKKWFEIDKHNFQILSI